MKYLVLLLILALPSYGALSANTVWEVRTAGNDTNGGGFVTGASGTDWSLFDNKNASGCSSCGSGTDDLSVTDGVTNGTTTITSATANFGTTIVGNVIYVQGGTGSITAGWYQVTARTNSTTITVDRSTGLTTGTGVTINIGGALASPGQAGAIAVTGNIVFVKYNASPFSVTSTSAGAAGVISSAANFIVCGYDSTRTTTNTDANRPTLQLNVASATLIQTASPVFINMILDGNSQTSAKLYSSMTAYRVHIINFNTASTGALACVYCTATTNSAAVFVGGTCSYCEMYANTATPMSGTNCIYSISYSNTGATTDGYAPGSFTIGCVAYNNGRDGFAAHANASAPGFMLNNISESNVRYGYVWSGANKRSINNAAYGNGTAAQLNTSIESGFITVTAGSVFVNAASSDFDLNNTTNQGALLRSAAFPSTFPVATSTSNYMDIGAVRHQDPTVINGGAFGYVK